MLAPRKSLAQETPGGYRVVDFLTGRPGQGPLRLHLTDAGGLHVAGIERPEKSTAPGD